MHCHTCCPTMKTCGNRTTFELPRELILGLGRRRHSHVSDRLPKRYLGRRLLKGGGGVVYDRLGVFTRLPRSYSRNLEFGTACRCSQGWFEEQVSC